MEKSAIILSNFWDANSLIDQGYILYSSKGNEVYKINFCSDSKHDSNYSVYSIALSHPDLKNKVNLSLMTRLDFFCPTYDMLKRYKSDGDWEAYTKDYMNLLRNRKSKMSEWMDSLIGDRVYFLCCWENTSGKAHCHREILYRVMLNSKKLSEKAIIIFRKGNEIKKQDRHNILDSDVQPSDSAPFSLNPLPE